MCGNERSWTTSRSKVIILTYRSDVIVEAGVIVEGQRQEVIGRENSPVAWVVSDFD